MAAGSDGAGTVRTTAAAGSDGAVRAAAVAGGAGAGMDIAAADSDGAVRATAVAGDSGAGMGTAAADSDAAGMDTASASGAGAGMDIAAAGSDGATPGAAAYAAAPDVDAALDFVGAADNDHNKAGRFLWPALAFLLPVAIHALAFAVIGVSPFGDRTKSMMVIDNFHQYSPFLSEFRDILKNGGSLLYSWNDGLGSNYWARYAYYLASPLNLLSTLFPAQALPEFIVFLTLFRTGFSGFAFFTYSRAKSGKAGPETVAFAAMYAISAYTLAYYWNIMWFDCIALFPLVALGLERIARGRSGTVYCIALAVAMYSNYYISLIICIFAVIYFLVCSVAGAAGSIKAFFRNAARFAAYSALSAGLAAVVLLPTISALSVSQSAGAKFPSLPEFYYNILEILAGHLFNVTPSVMSGMPNIYCGAAVLILIPLYFLNRKFPFREKAAYGALLAFMVLSCNVNYLNFIWHGLHFPNSLPYRFTFLYIFIIAALSLKAFQNLDETSGRTVFAAFAAAAAYVLTMQKLAPDIVSDDILYPSLAFLGLYAAVLAWAASSARLSAAPAVSARVNTAPATFPHLSAAPATFPYLSTAPATFPHLSATPAFPHLSAAPAVSARVNTAPATFPHLSAAPVAAAPKGAAAGAVIAMLLLTTVELSINAGLGIGAAGIGQRGNYMADLDEVKAAVSKVSEGAPNDFYRIEFLKDTVSNTPSLYGYKGASYFSSTAVLDVTDMMGKLGFRPSSAWYIYKGSTPVINSLLSLRYLLSKEDTYDNPLYPHVGEFDGVNVYENPYCLPLGFFTDRDLLNLSMKQPDVFKIQNDFIRRSVGAGTGAVAGGVAGAAGAGSGAGSGGGAVTVDGADIPDVLYPAKVELSSTRNSEITGQSGNLYQFRLLNPTEAGFINFTIKNETRAGAAYATEASAAGTAGMADVAGAAGATGGARQAPLYLYIQSRQIDYVWYIKNGQSEGHNIKYYPYIIDTQYFGDAGEIEISLKAEDNTSGSFEIYAYYFDEDAFKKAYDILDAKPFTLDYFSDARLSGSITADRGGLLFTTIPYDRGWGVWLDGAKLPPERIALALGGFLSVYIGPGAHRVEFAYTPPLFTAGLAISLFCTALLAALLISNHSAKKRFAGRRKHTVQIGDI